MDLIISALTSKIEAIQGELVKIQSYISRRPEASASIDRRNKKLTDILRHTSVDGATNRGRLVPKVTSNISDTHYQGEKISADTYATLRRHEFNLESLGDRLQKIENTTTTIKEKWRRGDEAMLDFTGEFEFGCQDRLCLLESSNSEATVFSLAFNTTPISTSRDLFQTEPPSIQFPVPVPTPKTDLVQRCKCNQCLISSLA
ncbi:hypothetical protein F2Q68_00025655 [Brassica cretica]|uniref:Uncharacterized protein n=1 Tax=Brassica cretica TaxID=69181 RepID=A0A8S9IJT5_BRACR|nr:hypothetical protein F2Q68_00025655 [Brassica cretica]